MGKLKIDLGGWVVVCDGGKAMILKNVGDRVYPNLRAVEIREHEGASTQEQGADSPGRVHFSAGPARSSVEQTDWHDQAERRFLDGLADRLDKAIGDEETTALIIVASPRALGMLRGVLTDRVRGAVHEEIGKDLVKLPIYEIEQQLFGQVGR